MPLHSTPTYTWPNTNENITWLSLEDPLCANDTCVAFSEAHDASQALISWNSQFQYGHYVLMVWGCVLGLAMVVGSAKRLQHFHAGRTSVHFVNDSPTTMQKATAIARSIAYRRASARVANKMRLPNAGSALIALLGWLFAIGLMFAEHPCYRENRGYGSPPLGIRAGLAGVALTPIVFALSGKYNLVTLLTGISHERLNFLHRQLGLIYLFLSVVHTIPFLVNDYTSGGSKRLWYQFYNAGSYEYTGIPPLAVLVFLCAFSNPGFRSLAYELFVHTHILAAIAYLGTIFWHAADRKDSWIYLWATVVIWVVQLAARAWDKTAMFEIHRKVRNGTAHISTLDDTSGHAAMMRVSVQLPLQWSPGQHAFLRFPRLGLLDNHPFTIASLPISDPFAEDSRTQDVSKGSELLFLVRPYHGLTKRLYAKVLEGHNEDVEVVSRCEYSTDPNSRMKVKASMTENVRIDGPYGGLSQQHGLHKRYDHVVLIAGGGGISAMLPWLMSLSAGIGDVNEPRRVRKVDLIWCVRHSSAAAWVEDELRECQRLAGKDIQIVVHVTGAKHVESPNGACGQFSHTEQLSEKASPAAEGNVGKQQQGMRICAGRPFIPSLLKEMVTLRKTFIMACGPESLKIDVSNAAATLQRMVLKGVAEEVSLHCETFGW